MHFWVGLEKQKIPTVLSGGEIERGCVTLNDSVIFFPFRPLFMRVPPLRCHKMYIIPETTFITRISLATGRDVHLVVFFS